MWPLNFTSIQLVWLYHCSTVSKQMQGKQKNSLWLSPQAVLLCRCILLGCRIGGGEHILGEDAEATGGVVHQHVGDRTHQLTVLHDG